jgi:hypothetical protein
MSASNPGAGLTASRCSELPFHETVIEPPAELYVRVNGATFVGESGTEEPGVDESGVDELGTDESGVDESGVDELGTDESGVDESGVDELGAEETGFEVSTADVEGSDDVEGADVDGSILEDGEPPASDVSGRVSTVVPMLVEDSATEEFGGDALPEPAIASPLAPTAKPATQAVMIAARFPNRLRSEFKPEMFIVILP